MGLSEGREAEHSGAGLLLPVADFIIDTPHGAGGGVGWWEIVASEGTRLSLGAYLPYTTSPHLFQLPGTINTNIPTSISAFQGRKALMRIYCPVVVTMRTPRDAEGIVHLHTP